MKQPLHERSGLATSRSGDLSQCTNIDMEVWYLLGLAHVQNVHGSLQAGLLYITWATLSGRCLDAFVAST